jgi:hypothetical protein
MNKQFVEYVTFLAFLFLGMCLGLLANVFLTYVSYLLW